MRKRFSVRNPGQVTGYSVALPGDTAKDGPRLRQRWTPLRATPGRPHLNLTDEQRTAAWEHATRIAADATAQIRNLAGTNPAAAADAAWATSDTLHVAATMLGSRLLRQAADAYDRAARAPHGHIPPPTPAGNRLRQAARLLSAFTFLTGDRPMAQVVLITKLAALAEAVAELRHAQQHAAHAAAERLHAAAHPPPAGHPLPVPRATTAAQLAGLSFPSTAPSRQPPAPGQPGSGQSGLRRPRDPRPPRPQGPSR